MKVILIYVLAAAVLFTGCATKSSVEALSDRVTKIKVEQDCASKILESMIAANRFQQMANNEKTDPMQMMQMQIVLQEISRQAQFACAKLEAQEAEEQKAAEKSKPTNPGQDKAHPMQ